MSEQRGFWQELPHEELDWDAIRRALDELPEAERLAAAQRYILARYGEVDRCPYCLGPLNRDDSCAASCVGVGDG